MVLYVNSRLPYLSTKISSEKTMEGIVNRQSNNIIERKEKLRKYKRETFGSLKKNWKIVQDALLRDHCYQLTNTHVPVLPETDIWVHSAGKWGEKRLKILPLTLLPYSAHRIHQKALLFIDNASMYNMIQHFQKSSVKVTVEGARRKRRLKNKWLIACWGS